MSRYIVPIDDKHPRSRKAYRKAPLKREDQEEKEAYPQDISDSATSIIQGDWKLNVHKLDIVKSFGFRRYHRHGKWWYCVISVIDNRDVAFPTAWKCGHCGERMPDEMEGYIKLARWAVNDV